MVIHIELFGPVKSPRGARTFAVDATEGDSVRTVLVDRVGFAEEDLRLFSVLRRGERLRLRDPVAHGDRLEVFLPVGGG